MAKEESIKAAGGFDELWGAYSRKGKRADAKHAYVTLAPSAELHNRLVEAAKSWAANYAAIGREKKYQKFLHTWLKGEAWLEDLPAAYESAKDAAVAKAETKATQDMPQELDLQSDNDHIGLTPKTPIGRHAVEIIGSDIFSTGNFDKDSTTLRFDYRINGGKYAGKTFSHKFFLQCPDDLKCEDGQKVFRDIRKATGIEPEDTREMHGAKMLAIVGRGAKIEYEPL